MFSYFGVIFMINCTPQMLSHSYVLLRKTTVNIYGLSLSEEGSSLLMTLSLGTPVFIDKRQKSSRELWGAKKPPKVPILCGPFPIRRLWGCYLREILCQDVWIIFVPRTWSDGFFVAEKHYTQFWEYKGILLRQH